MTNDLTLEVGDLILFQYRAGSDLVMVDTVGKKIAKVVTPEGFLLIIDKQTDGNLAYLPYGLINPFAIMTVIPKNESVLAHTPFGTNMARIRENPVASLLRQFRGLFQNYRPSKADARLLNLKYRKRSQQ